MYDVELTLTSEVNEGLIYWTGSKVVDGQPRAKVQSDCSLRWRQRTRNGALNERLLGIALVFVGSNKDATTNGRGIRSGGWSLCLHVSQLVCTCVCVCASFSVALELWNFAEGPRVGGLAVGGKGPPLTIIKLV